MANTKAQTEAENWIITQHLPLLFNQPFRKKQIGLTWGGKFSFDAVSEDGGIIANISTSGAKTGTGNPGSGKFHKINSDALFLLHANHVSRRLLVFTEKTMAERFEREKHLGRFPQDIELIYAELPKDIGNRVKISRFAASQEVSPRK